jgi:hypothetical protein
MLAAFLFGPGLIYFYYMFPIFNKYSNLTIVMSEKRDGSMKLMPDDSPNTGRNLGNRKRFLEKKGINPDFLISAEIVHGSSIEIVSARDSNKVIAGVDGLLTNEKNIFLAVTVADCLPIFLYEPVKNVFGIMHAGWRGLEKDIAGVAVNKMKSVFSCKPEDILIGIGPGICQKDFEVGGEVAEKFIEYPEAILREDKKIFLDLKKIAAQQFLRQGVAKNNIEISFECVFELPDKYFSYRREKSKDIEAMAAVIGIRA